VGLLTPELGKVFVGVVNEFVKSKLGRVFVTPVPPSAGVVRVLEVVGVALKGAGVVIPVPVFMLLGLERSGEETMMPVGAGLPTIVPGVPDAGAGPKAGAVLTPAAPLVTPVAVPEEVPDGVEAAPAGLATFGVAAVGLVVPYPAPTS
jgi:hypothetical protein